MAARKRRFPRRAFNVLRSHAAAEAVPAPGAPDAPTITAPLDEDVIVAGHTIALAATVTDTPDSVQFVLDPGGSEQVLATVNGAPFETTIVVPVSAGDGLHTLVARSVTGALSTDSAPIDLEVWVPPGFATSLKESVGRDSLWDVGGGGGVARYHDRSGYVATMAGNPNLTFAEVGATGDTIERQTGSFLTDGFFAGMLLTSDSPLNTFSGAKITGVTATVLTLDTQDLVAEGPINGVTLTAVPPGWTQPTVGNQPTRGGDGRLIFTQTNETTALQWLIADYRAALMTGTARPWSFAVRFRRVAGVGNHGTMWGVGNSGAATGQTQVQVPITTGTGRYRIFRQADATFTPDATSTTETVDTNEHLWIATFSGSATPVCELDGVAMAMTLAGTFGGTMTVNIGTIGAGRQNAGPVNPWDGEILEWYFWDAELDSGQVADVRTHV